MQTIVVISGGFDPIHSGHVSYINAAKEQGDLLYVGLNSDEWLIRKKGKYFLPLNERSNIVSNFKNVDKVLSFNDEDGSAKHLIKKVRALHPTDKILFCNGGDRTFKNIPEMDVEDSNIEFLFGVGGEDKKNSSSWILKEWESKKLTVDKKWGSYTDLYSSSENNTKVKELVILPGQSISMQKHFNRSEHWFVTEGEATVFSIKKDKLYKLGIFDVHKIFHFGKEEWHMVANMGNKILKVIEIQYGEKCIEEDIERASAFTLQSLCTI